MSQSQLVAPPASSVRMLAQSFGASCTIRFSRHAYSGVVVVARFAQPGLASGFARLASRLAGYGCAVRVSTVSVPVAPVSPLLPRPPAPPQVSSPAAVVISPPAPVARCMAYLASGQPCTRKAKHGHYCGIHAKAVM